MEKQLKEVIKKYEKELKELESYKLKLVNVYSNKGNINDKITLERTIAKIELLKEVLKDLDIKEDKNEDLNVEEDKEIKRQYETYIKLENGKWHFLGWYTMNNEKFCIETKTRGKYIYKTYRWLTGTIEEYRYGSYIEQ